MTEEKGLSPSIADAIGEYVNRRGLRDLLDNLQSDTALTSNASAKKGLEDMDLLFTYLEALNVLNNVSFDLSLARGLDYYTGIIFEVITEGSAAPSSNTNASSADPTRRLPKASPTADADEDRSADPSIGVGSLAAGGRYDELVGMFSSKSQQIPCVGTSFGVDRIFSLIKARMEAEKKKKKKDQAGNATIRNTEVDAYVMAFGGKGFTGLLAERMEVVKMLWDAGIKVVLLSPLSHKRNLLRLTTQIRPNSHIRSNLNYPLNSKRPRRTAFLLPLS